MKKYIQLITSWITLFIVGTDLFVVSPLLPKIVHSLNISSEAASWIVTSFAVVYAIMAPLFGLLADNWGKRRNIVIGLFLFSLANLTTYYSTTYIFIISSRLLAGGTAAMITSAVFAITGDLAPKNKNGLWLSIATSGFLTAIWIGAPLGNFIGTLTTWRTVFIILAIGTLILSITNHFVYPQANKATPNKLNKSIFKNIILDVNVTTFWALAVYGVYTFLGSIFNSITHFSNAYISIAYIFYGIGALLGSISGGILADKFGHQKIIQTSIIGLSGSLFILGLVFSFKWLLLPVLAVWGITAYLVFSSYQSYVSTIYHNFSGNVMAWNQTAMYIGITLGSLIGGILMKHQQVLLLTILCALSAIIGLIWFKIRQKYMA